MSNKFENQLKLLINEDELEKTVDGLADDIKDEEEKEEIQRDMTPVEFEKKPTNMQPSEGSDFYDDYVFARSQYYGIIGRSNAALDLVLEIAKMSEHPRAIEVAATLMKTSADVTKELMALQAKQEEKKKSPEGQYVQNNTHHHYGASGKDTESIIDDLPDDDDE